MTSLVALSFWYAFLKVALIYPKKKTQKTLFQATNLPFRRWQNNIPCNTQENIFGQLGSLGNNKPV
jgi:hypothetical protein